MNKKKVLISVLVFLALAALVYLQVRTWRKFDWHRFWSVTEGVSISYILLGVALIYADYFLRAVRWKILLRPVRQTTAMELVAPTMVGFTGLALLGRPGEFIRPYLIARKTRLTVSSQLAVWLVERIFDMGAFALIMAVNILLSTRTLAKLPGFADGPPHSIGRYHLSSFEWFEISGFGLLAVVVVMACIAFLVRRNPSRVARISERLIGGTSGQMIRTKVQAFGEGLNTVKDFKSFVQLSGISLLIWLVIGFAYLAVIHAYHNLAVTHHYRHFLEISFPGVLLLTAASVVGGVLQLPVVGGGSQLATIGVLHGIFNLSPELSTSCGIMLWLVTFMSVIPAGLFLAHRERLSLIKLEKESEKIAAGPPDTHGTPGQVGAREETPSNVAITKPDEPTKRDTWIN
ncbi:MAG TPA: lysylphosphatidylglycerol synthase transmembrane domain-containing protein [Candidatus Angelobacter sp.]